MRILIYAAIALLSSACAAEEGAPSYGYASECLSTPNQKAELQTFLLPINLNDPRGDAEIRIGHGDMRFLAVGGLGVKVPGLPSGGNKMVCRYGIRVVDGITDVGGDAEYNKLVSRVYRYAAQYNQAAFELISNQEK